MWRKPCLIEKRIFSKPLGDLNQRWLQRSIETTVCARFAQYLPPKIRSAATPSKQSLRTLFEIVVQTIDPIAFRVEPLRRLATKRDKAKKLDL